MATLRLVTSYRIGIFHLQSIVMRVSLHLFHPFTLYADIGIIFHYGIKKFIIHFFRQRWCFGMERIEQEFHFQFHIIIIRKTEKNIRKAETIHFSLPTNSTNHRDIAISNEIYFFATFRPKIIIFSYHQQIARFQFFFPIKNRIPYTFIIDIGPFVRATYHNRFIHSHPIVTIGDSFYQFIPWDDLDIGKSFYLDRRKRKEILFGNVSPKFCCIPKNTRVLQLTNYFGQQTFINLQTISFQYIC